MLLEGALDEEMPDTLDEDDGVSESDPNIDAAIPFSADRVREWAVSPNEETPAEAEDNGGEGFGTAPVFPKGEWGGSCTYDGRGPRGIVVGMCNKPIAETELSRFFSAANALDCGRSIKRPYKHL